MESLPHSWLAVSRMVDLNYLFHCILSMTVMSYKSLKFSHLNWDISEKSWFLWSVEHSENQILRLFYIGMRLLPTTATIENHSLCFGILGDWNESESSLIWGRKSPDCSQIKHQLKLKRIPCTEIHRPELFVIILATLKKPSKYT